MKKLDKKLRVMATEMHRLKDLGIEKEINKTLQLLDHFFGNCQEQFDGRNTWLVF